MCVRSHFEVPVEGAATDGQIVFEYEKLICFRMTAFPVTFSDARIVALLLLIAAVLKAQADPRDVGPILEQQVQPSAFAEVELRQYLTARIPILVGLRDEATWEAESRRIRRHLLVDVIYHGWLRSWVEGTLRADDIGTVEQTPASRCRLHKFPCEIVSGFWAPAVLYEPIL